MPRSKTDDYDPLAAVSGVPAVADDPAVQAARRKNDSLRALAREAEQKAAEAERKLAAARTAPAGTLADAARAVLAGGTGAGPDRAALDGLVAERHRAGRAAAVFGMAADLHARGELAAAEAPARRAAHPVAFEAVVKPLVRRAAGYLAYLSARHALAVAADRLDGLGLTASGNGLPYHPPAGFGPHDFRAEFRAVAAALVADGYFAPGEPGD